MALVWDANGHGRGKQAAVYHGVLHHGFFREAEKLRHVADSSLRISPGIFDGSLVRAALRRHGVVPDSLDGQGS